MKASMYIGKSSKVNKLPKEKKMGWFDRWFDRKCRESWERSRSSDRPIAVVEDSSPNADGLNIRIFGATGGTIVEFRRYDRGKDRHDNKMYVIPTEQNFSEQFAKVVSMEMMR